uniref:Carboxyl-terminal-processing peptidase 1ic isoform X5 n=1 Tax=Rhizophora mucronata TaxID=61149 RepID=A0A2P2LXQ7_RHIMU
MTSKFDWKKFSITSTGKHLPIIKSFLANALNSFRRIYPTEVVPLSTCSNR